MHATAALADSTPTVPGPPLWMLTEPWPVLKRPVPMSPTDTPALPPWSVTAFLPTTAGRDAVSNSRLYICTPNKGKAAAKLDRAKLFAARADAAYTGYCEDRYSVATRPSRSTYAVDEEREHARIHPDDAVHDATVSSRQHVARVAARPGKWGIDSVSPNAKESREDYWNCR